MCLKNKCRKINKSSHTQYYTYQINTCWTGMASRVFKHVICLTLAYLFVYKFLYVLLFYN